MTIAGEGLPGIALIDANFELLVAARQDAGRLSALLDATIADGWLDFPEALDAMCADYEKSPGPRRWGTLFFLLDTPRRLVGWGGYKGEPKQGVVEFGYAIAPGERGKGYATAAAQAMIDRAFASPEVSAVTAHTLAADSASTAILRKLGFAKGAELIDPEDGPIWNWRRERID